MTHSLPIPTPGSSPKHALTLAMTLPQALAICCSGNYGIRHLKLWFIGIIFPHFAHSLNTHRLSAFPKPHSRESCSQRGSTLGAQHVPACPTLLSPCCCVLGYRTSQAPRAAVGLQDHGSALAGVDPWLGLGLQSSDGRHRDCKLALRSMEVD